jgi:ATP-dependent protease ClpP protease subunit
MTHKGSAILEGDEDEVESQKESFSRCTDKYWKLLERHSGRKATTWLKRSKRQGELWMPPKELLKCKAIDGVLKSERRSFSPLITKRVQDIIAEMDKLQDAVEDQEEDQEEE